MDNDQLEILAFEKIESQYKKYIKKSFPKIFFLKKSDFQEYMEQNTHLRPKGEISDTGYYEPEFRKVFINDEISNKETILLHELVHSFAGRIIIRRENLIKTIDGLRVTQAEANIQTSTLRTIFKYLEINELFTDLLANNCTENKVELTNQFGQEYKEIFTEHIGNNQSLINILTDAYFEDNESRFWKLHEEIKLELKPEIYNLFIERNPNERTFNRN